MVLVRWIGGKWEKEEEWRNAHGYDGDVGEMGAAEHGMVGDEDVAAFELAFPDGGLFLDAG